MNESEMQKKIVELETENKALTKIVCALHKRMGGGQVIIPIREWVISDGREVDIVANESTISKGMTLEINYK